MSTTVASTTTPKSTCGPGEHRLLVADDEADDLQHDDAHHDADVAAHRGEDGRLLHDAGHDRTRRRPDGAPHADLRGALADGDEEDVADTDDARQERADADEPRDAADGGEMRRIFPNSSSVLNEPIAISSSGAASCRACAGFRARVPRSPSRGHREVP
jgi:hypothetical protein